MNDLIARSISLYYIICHIATKLWITYREAAGFEDLVLSDLKSGTVNGHNIIILPLAIKSNIIQVSVSFQLDRSVKLEMYMPDFLAL